MPEATAATAATARDRLERQEVQDFSWSKPLLAPYHTEVGRGLT
jgi:hypothetical protein